MGTFSECLICSGSFSNKKDFGYHLQFVHKIKVEDYVVKYKFGGEKPLCAAAGCDKETRYVRQEYDFKKYCKDHSRLAMSEGGRIGGKAEAWSKGKTKEDDPRLMEYSRKYLGSGNPFAGKKHSEETKNKIKKNKKVSKEEFEDRIKSREEEFKCLTPYGEYCSRQHQYLLFECVKCGTAQEKTLQAFERNSLCEKCFPCSTSQAEVEIADFVESLDFEIKRRSKNIIPPYEIDIFVEEKGLGIEHNGLYHHSEANGKDKNYHINKTRMMNDLGCSLLHIFSDDWENKKDLLKSMIKNRLGICDRKIFARKCDFKEIETKEAKKFLSDNHISGYVRSCWKGGLFYNNELIAVMTLRKPRQKKYKDYFEVARFACLQNVLVVGGFSKVLKKAEEYCSFQDMKGLMSYCDLSYGTGNVYKSSGFEYVGETELNYWYCNPQQRFDRFKFKAQNGKSEKEVALENKVARIYGCGNSVWRKDLS